MAPVLNRRCSAPDLSRWCSVSKAPVLHSAETSLLVRVQLPAANWDSLLRFKIKPGGACEEMQKGVEAGVSTLITNLRSYLDESDLQSNDRNFGVAISSCEDQLQEWQEMLSDAKSAILRSDTLKAEMTRMKESYLKEISLLRQQLSFKKMAEEKGQEFMVESVSHLTEEDKTYDNEAMRPEIFLELQQELHRTKATLERKELENHELMNKVKTMKMQTNMQTDLLARRIDLREFVEAEVQTSPPSRCERFTSTEPTNMVTVEVQTRPEPPDPVPSVALRAPAKRKTTVTQPLRSGNNRTRTMSGMKINIKDADLFNSDDDNDDSDDGEQVEDAVPEPIVECEAEAVEPKVVRINPDPVSSANFRQFAPPVSVSIAVQVDDDMLSPGDDSPMSPPVSPCSPHPGGRRPWVGRSLSQTNTNDEASDDQDADYEVAKILNEAPNLPPLAGEGSSRSKSASKNSRRAVSLPVEAELSAMPLMTISSQAHCLAFVPKATAEAARPSSRTISKPRFSRSGSRSGATTPTARMQTLYSLGS